MKFATALSVLIMAVVVSLTAVKSKHLAENNIDGLESIIELPIEMIYVTTDNIGRHLAADRPSIMISSQQGIFTLSVVARDETVVRLNYRNGDLIRTFQHPRPVVSIAFNDDLTRIITVDVDGIERVWDLWGDLLHQSG